MSLRRAISILRSDKTRRLMRRSWSSGAPIASLSAQSEYTNNQSFREYFSNGVVALSLLAGASAASCASITKSKCEEANGEDESYDVFSSSDPMDLPTQSDDGIPLERILLTEISNPKSKTEELQDDSSDFSKSVRAFGSCLESTAAIRRRDTPLATSKGDISAEERISTLESHENETVTTRNVYFYKASQIHDGMADRFVLLAGPSSEDLGGDIAHLLGVAVSRAEVGKFADG